MFWLETKGGTGFQFSHKHTQTHKLTHTNLHGTHTFPNCSSLTVAIWNACMKAKALFLKHWKVAFEQGRSSLSGTKSELWCSRQTTWAKQVDGIGQRLHCNDGTASAFFIYSTMCWPGLGLSLTWSLPALFFALAWLLLRCMGFAFALHWLWICFAFCIGLALALPWICLGFACCLGLALALPWICLGFKKRLANTSKHQTNILGASTHTYTHTHTFKV